MRFKLLLLALLLTTGGPVVGGHKDRLCLNEVRNPFLLQAIPQESRSVVDYSALERLKKRIV